MDTTRASRSSYFALAAGALALTLAPRPVRAQTTRPAPTAGPVRLQGALPREAHELSARLEAPRTREPDPRTLCGRGQGRGPEQSVAFYDPTNRRWVVADVEHEPGETPRVAWFGTASEAGDSVAPSPASGRALCQALRGTADLAPAPNLVSAEATRANALGATVPLVRAGSWLVYVARGDDDTDAAYAFRPDRSQRWRLATRPSLVAPEARGGRTARANPPAAYQWLGITAVRRAPDGSSLLVQGYRGPAEARGAGPFHWVIPLRGADAPFAAP